MHPIAFTIGGVTIHWYGILLATGFMVGLWTAGRRGMRIGINPEDLSNLVIWIFVGGVAGAKILFVINHWNGEQPLKELILQRSGMVFHGALIGTSISIWVFTRTKKMPLWATFDSLAPSFALGHAFGRIGCFMTGCCYGKVCNLPWAVQFPDSHATHPSYIHPTQIYECLLNFALYGALAWLFRKRKFDGQVFTAYLLGYAALRFGMEFLRDDGRGRMWFNTLTSGQGISILLLIVGVALWIILKDKVNIVVERAISKKRRLVAFALCFFAGFIGAHRFYVGKTTSGTIQFLTLGGLGIWVIVDMILILTGSFTDKDDKIVSNWE